MIPTLFASLRRQSLLMRVLMIVTSVVVVVGVVFRLIHLGEPDVKIFDEVYFPVFAWDFLHGKYDFDVHPPLGKLLIAVGEYVFGNRSFGWRIMPALFGIAFIPLAVAIWRRFQPEEGVGSWLMASFVALDGILIAYSRVGLMDGILLFAIALCFYLSMREERPRSGIALATCIGLAISIKWVAAGILVPIAYRMWRSNELIPFLFSLSWSIFVYGLVVCAGFVIGHSANPWQQTSDWQVQALNYQLTLKATHPYSSPWWSWPLLKHPVLMYNQFLPNGDSSIMTGLPNPLLLWSSTLATVVAIGDVLRELWLKRTKALDHPLIILLLGYLAFLLPFAPVHRVLFLYHYLPSYFFAILILTYYMSKMWRRSPYLVLGIFVLILLSGLYFMPLVTAAPISQTSLAQHLWFRLWLYGNP